MSLQTDANTIEDIFLGTLANKQGALLALTAFKLAQTPAQRTLSLNLLKLALEIGVDDT
jgi:hypothetical protein